MEARLLRALMGLGLLIAPLARADGARSDVDVCASASEDAQRLNVERKLLEARERLLVCTRPVCPAPIRSDCDQLLSEVEAATPTVVLGLRDAEGHDLRDAVVTLDGARWTGELDGSSAPVNPGNHSVRADRRGARVELAFVAHEGEKNRIVQLALGREGVPAAPPTLARAKPPWTFYALGGVSVISLGVFAYLAANGQSTDDACTKNGCGSSQVAALQRERAIAWSTLGVGVVSGAGAVWLFASRGISLRAHVAVIHGTPGLGLNGAFQ
jgi:hypothetical protein